MTTVLALLLIDHGSRIAEANAELLRVVRLVQAQAGASVVVRHAHMELAEPSVPAAIAGCVEEGATEIVIDPYLLAPGRHARQDIPRLVATAERAYPAVRFRITAPLGVHPKIGEVVLERAGLPVLGTPEREPED